MKKKILIMALLLLISIAYMATVDCSRLSAHQNTEANIGDYTVFSTWTNYPGSNDFFQAGAFQCQGFGYVITGLTEYSYDEDSGKQIIEETNAYWEYGVKHFDRLPAACVIFLIYFVVPCLMILLGRLMVIKRSIFPYVFLLAAVVMVLLLYHFLVDTIVWSQQAILLVLIVCYYLLAEQLIPYIISRIKKNQPNQLN